MGTATAPNYANLFMDRFETKALANWAIETSTMASVHRRHLDGVDTWRRSAQ